MGNGLLSTDDAAGIDFGLSAESCWNANRILGSRIQVCHVVIWFLTAGVDGVSNFGRGEVARALGNLGPREKLTPGENLLVGHIDSRLSNKNELPN